MISRQTGENSPSVLGWEDHAQGMVNTNTHNGQQNNFENNSQFESPHCLLTFPEEVEEMKEPNLEAS
jgi:hypothetical protein